MTVQTVLPGTPCTILMTLSSPVYFWKTLLWQSLVLSKQRNSKVISTTTSAVNRETRWWWWCLQGWIRHACKENHQHPVQDFLRMSMKCPVPVATSYRYYYFLQTHLSKWIPTLNFCYYISKVQSVATFWASLKKKTA